MSPSPEELINTVRPIISIANFMIALVEVALSIPLLLGKVPMNEEYGMRIPESFTSDENWYKINTFSAQVFLLLHALPSVIAGVWMLFLPFKSRTELIGYFIVGHLLMIGLVLLCVLLFVRNFVRDC